MLISGEAGIGKTTLANVLGREAAMRGVLVLVGRCYDGTETPPYGLWVDLFARYQPATNGPTVPPAFGERGAIGPIESQARLFNQMLDFFRALATDSPLLLILDDLHWSDPASLDLLRFLARSIGVFPLLIVATYRSDEIPGDHPLAPLLPLLVREAEVARLDLRRLDEGALRAFVVGRYHVPEQDAASLARYLIDRTEGNPLFMTELLRTLEEEGILR